jgi:hypothetical protein
MKALAQDMLYRKRLQFRVEHSGTKPEHRMGSRNRTILWKQNSGPDEKEQKNA